MKNIRHYLTAAAGFILFAVVVGLSLAQNGQSSMAADSKDVRVVNSTAEAVPVAVQGTTSVNIANAPTVDARQNGAWNVGIAGVPTVSVGNNGANPVLVRNVDRPEAQPFQYQAVVTLEDGFGGGSAVIPIPVGKLLVIEHVSARGSVPSGQGVGAISISTRIFPDNTNYEHFLQYSKEDLGSFGTQYQVSQQLRLYADGSTTARVIRGPADGAVTFVFVVSGYLVNRTFTQ